jgi:hypothetical protein
MLGCPGTYLNMDNRRVHIALAVRFADRKSGV